MVIYQRSDRVPIGKVDYQVQIEKEKAVITKKETVTIGKSKNNQEITSLLKTIK